MNHFTKTIHFNQCVRIQKNRGSVDETSKSDRGARSIPRFLRADRREGRFSKEADVSLPNTSQKGHLLLSSDQIKPCLFFLVWGGDYTNR